MPGAPNSPSPLQHHPAYGMNGMMGHPFVTDRYRESHNSSPRSGTDDDGMNTPTSGIFAGTHLQHLSLSFLSLFPFLTVLISRQVGITSKSFLTQKN
jgi:hypothetical protein